MCSVRLHLVWLFLLAGGLAKAETGPSTAGLGKTVDNVSLVLAGGQPGKLHEMFRDRKAVVLVFLSFDCPVSNSYSADLAEMTKTYGPRGVGFLGVCPGNPTDSEMAKQVREFGLPFPVCRDPGLKISDALKAEVTPEAFLLDDRFILRYRGRIDNTWAARLKRNQQTTRADLQVALDEVLAGKAVSEPATEAIGCPILRDRPRTIARTDVTFHRDVLPILQSRCQGCHRPGEVGPFSLMTYRQAVTWASDIKAYTQSRQMPPWKPVAGPAFRDDRRMTDREIATLAAWVDGGTPEGDPRDAPPPARFPQGWQLGEPDLVLTVGDDFQVGPSGNDIFRCFVLPTNLAEDRYISAVEVRPGNSRVVHHALLFIDSTGQGRRLESEEQKRPRKEGELDVGPGYSVSMGVGFTPQGGLGGWAPGQVPRHLPDGTGYFLPKGADVVVQIHYHRTGRVEKDRTSIGLYFARKPVEKRYQGTVIPGRFFFIPPGVADYTVKGTRWVDRDFQMYSIMPHMHMLGRRIKVTMTPPGGQTMTLVEIDQWDYNWQETYFFKEAIPVKAGTRFDVEAVYDNSAGNPSNPNNPPRFVKFGQQTTDEMCFVFLGGTPDTPGRIRTRSTPPE